jgi:hypothetical protein
MPQLGWLERPYLGSETSSCRKETVLGARTKLNEANVLSSLGAAEVLGFLTGSFTVFLIAGAVLIAAGLYAGDIRPGKGKSR